jgi:hypothetical protein
MDKNIKEQIIELQRQQLELDKKAREVADKKYEKNLEARKRAKIKEYLETPRKIKLLNGILKVGDVIRCKGYKGEKQITLIKDNKVFAMCGRIDRRTNQFIPNGSGSETSIENVTEICGDNYTPKWIKVKDLLK